MNAILRDASGVEQNRVGSPDWGILILLVETFLLPGCGPGDTIEFGEDGP
jgi:hypothetical protein